MERVRAENSRMTEAIVRAESSSKLDTKKFNDKKTIKDESESLKFRGDVTLDDNGFVVKFKSHLNKAAISEVEGNSDKEQQVGMSALAEQIQGAPSNEFEVVTPMTGNREDSNKNKESLKKAIIKSVTDGRKNLKEKSLEKGIEPTELNNGDCKNSERCPKKSDDSEMKSMEAFKKSPKWIYGYHFFHKPVRGKRKIKKRMKSLKDVRDIKFC